jgi:hypothetical protein
MELIVEVSEARFVSWLVAVKIQRLVLKTNKEGGVGIDAWSGAVPTAAMEDSANRHCQIIELSVTCCRSNMPHAIEAVQSLSLNKLLQCHGQ